MNNVVLYMGKRKLRKAALLIQGHIAGKSVCVCVCVCVLYCIGAQSQLGFPGGSDCKESACNRDLGLIPGLEKCPGEGNGYPLQYCDLENFMDRGAWQATVHGVAKSRQD